MLLSPVGQRNCEAGPGFRELGGPTFPRSDAAQGGAEQPTTNAIVKATDSVLLRRLLPKIMWYRNGIRFVALN